MLDVKTPESAHEWDQVRALMRAFVAWHRERHRQDIHLVDSYFDAAAFDAELTTLPGPYAPPQGRLLLARLDGQAAGCVALKDLGGSRCEMKRMFVRLDAQGHGVGRALATAIVAEARTAGYRTMHLDTSIRQLEAQALYRSLGFGPGEPDMNLPKELRDWLVFMALDLSAAAI
jgi:GNAT superfamily N-acetyltransferase